MPLALLIIGAVALAAAARGTHKELGTQLAHDLTGGGSFLYWLAALIALGAIGNLPGLRGFSRGFMALVLLSMALANGGVFAKLTAAIAAPPAPYHPALPGATPAVFATGGAPAGGSTAGGSTAGGASAGGSTAPSLSAWGEGADDPEAEFSAKGFGTAAGKGYLQGGGMGAAGGAYAYAGGAAGKALAYEAVEGDQQDQPKHAAYGATAGAAVGSFFGPIGTGVGALIGAFIGGTVFAGEPDFPLAWHYTYLGKRSANGTPELITAESGALNGGNVDLVSQAGRGLEDYIMARATAEGYAPNPGANQQHFAVGYRNDGDGGPFFFNTRLFASQEEGDVRFDTWEQVAEHAYRYAIASHMIVPGSMVPAGSWSNAPALPPHAYGAGFA